MARTTIHTDQAPEAIGTYSQAVRVGDLLFVSGQIPLDPATMTVVPGDFTAHSNQVFDNLSAILEAAGVNLDACVKLTVYLTDLERFGEVNAVMAERFAEPFPARAAVEVAGLPKGVAVEVDAIAYLGA